ncbi:zinc finger protein 541-like [Vespula squamosa]|uniref:Zinc finger protein 541-like n=1 Tax=Vespula squamosa TaxID=30214 RepID=A0ABD2AD80_VESSQ
MDANNSLDYSFTWIVRGTNERSYYEGILQETKKKARSLLSSNIFMKSYLDAIKLRWEIMKETSRDLRNAGSYSRITSANSQHASVNANRQSPLKRHSYKHTIIQHIFVADPNTYRSALNAPLTHISHAGILQNRAVINRERNGAVLHTRSTTSNAYQWRYTHQKYFKDVMINGQPIKYDVDLRDSVVKIQGTCCNWECSKSDNGHKRRFLKTRSDHQMHRYNRQAKMNVLVCSQISGNGSLELFDSESGPDLTLSPQTFTSTTEAFINDNSDSLGVPGDNDTVSLFFSTLHYSPISRWARPKSKVESGEEWLAGFIEAGLRVIPDEMDLRMTRLGRYSPIFRYF